jgi:hypothetical protein
MAAVDQLGFAVNSVGLIALEHVEGPISADEGA